MATKKDRQLEKENRLLQEEITIYRTYFRVCAEDGPVITLEEGERIGGFGERAAAYLAEALPGSRIRILAVDDRYVPQGTPDELRKRLGLDADSIAESIASFVRECGQE